MCKNERTGEEKTLEAVLLGIGKGKRKRKVEHYCRECKETTTHFKFTSYKKSDDSVEYWCLTCGTPTFKEE
jgi:hypothetical protein